MKGLAHRLSEALHKGVREEVFPGASAAVAGMQHGEEWVVVQSAGQLAWGSKPTTSHAFFDLASLTKPFVAIAALSLVQQHRLSLTLRAAEALAICRKTPLANVTLEALLTHRAGLPAWCPLYQQVPKNLAYAGRLEWYLQQIAHSASQACNPPAVYSDMGYIVAGAMLQHQQALPLDRLLFENVIEPLKLHQQIGYPPASTASRCIESSQVAATERCCWRGRVIWNEVHDENCAALGGVSGHAGLFGTAHGVAQFGLAMLRSLRGQGSFLQPKWLKYALAPRPQGTFRLGWDGKSAKGSSAGSRMSPFSFGHLGFAGTSIWCDPVRGVVVVLLTNRVHLTRENRRIRDFRPQFHDTVLRALEE